MRKQHGFTPKYTNVQAPTAAMNTHTGTQGAITNGTPVPFPRVRTTPHIGGPAGRRTPSGLLATAPTAATTTSVPGGKTAAATASGQTLWWKSSRPREPAIQARETEVQGCGRSWRSRRRRNLLRLLPSQHQWRRPPVRQHSTSKRRPSQSAPAGPHSRPHRGHPRTRAPPLRRTTCWATLCHGCRREEDLDMAGPYAARPLPGRRTERCTLSRKQQFAFPRMAGGSLRRAGGCLSPPNAGGRKELPAHAEATPTRCAPPPQPG
jgi:hypothetical protein